MSISDEIIVHKKDVAAPAGMIDDVQFRNHLVGCFHPHSAAEKNRDITKIAIEGTPSRKLNAHGGIFSHFYQRPHRNRSFVEIAESFRAINSLRTPFFKIR